MGVEGFKCASKIPSFGVAGKMSSTPCPLFLTGYRFSVIRESIEVWGEFMAPLPVFVE